jgi:hypothetical protein
MSNPQGSSSGNYKTVNQGVDNGYLSLQDVINGHGVIYCFLANDNE